MTKKRHFQHTQEKYAKSIKERSKIAYPRIESGHWKINLVLFKQIKNKVMLLILSRKINTLYVKSALQQISHY